MGLRHLLGVDQDDDTTASRPLPTRSVGAGDVLETADSGPLVVESVLPLGAAGDLCVAGDASTRRLLVVRRPSCWRLVPTDPSRYGPELDGALRAGGGVLVDGTVLEVFAAGRRIFGLVGAGLVLSCSIEEKNAEPVIWLPDGVAPPGIDDSYLALEPGEAETPSPARLLDELGARERPIS